MFHKHGMSISVIKLPPFNLQATTTAEIRHDSFHVRNANWLPSFASFRACVTRDVTFVSPFRGPPCNLPKIAKKRPSPILTTAYAHMKSIYLFKLLLTKIKL